MRAHKPQPSVQGSAPADIVALVAKGKSGKGTGPKGARRSAGEGGLHRLPPGRHGLSRDFVVSNQRDRITAGMIAAVAERGFHETTISDISRASGVSRRTFYGYFSSKEDCFFATYDLVATHLLEAAATAADSQEEWPLRVRAALAGTLEFFAANPDLARFMVIAPPRAGEEVAGRYRESTARALAQLTIGMPDGVTLPPAAIQHALIGGMAGLVAHKVEAGEGERLAELLPDLVELFLAPYLGREAAARIAAEAA